MRVFVAGATGAIGRPLVRLLVDAGHEVSSLTRDPAKAASLPNPVVADVYDLETLRDAIAAFAPDVVVNELTDLPADVRDFVPGRNIRIRTEGNRNLLAAANGAKVIVQSVAFQLEGAAGEAVRELERTTLEAGGVVLRYGAFYGPGTWYEGDELPEQPRVHVEEAARRTVEALDAPSGVVEVVD